MENMPEGTLKKKQEHETVPIYRKMNLTVTEAAEYSNIGINKLNELLRHPRCSFVLYVGNKKLVKRKQFEEYLADKIEI